MFVSVVKIVFIVAGVIEVLAAGIGRSLVVSASVVRPDSLARYASRAASFSWWTGQPL